MDLFDLDHYFGSIVPVQARSCPLLKHAACAYAAKQLGRMRRAQANVSGVASSQVRSDVFNDSSPDWEWEGAYHYDRSIALMMEEMNRDQSGSDLYGEPSDTSDGLNTIPALPSGKFMGQLRSDEVVAAAAILCVYEFLSACGAAWSRHLNGTKSLLDITGENVPLEMPFFYSLFPFQPRSSSKARRAVFWNFARQDHIAACKTLKIICVDCKEADVLKSSMNVKHASILTTSNCGGKPVSF